MLPVLIAFGRIPSGSIRSSFLHSGMGWLAIPIRLQQTSGFSVESALVNMSNHSPPCGSLPEQSRYLLPSPGYSDISVGCVWSWSGKPYSLQSGWPFDCCSEAGIPPIRFLALRWSPSYRVLPCRLIQPPYTPLQWLIVRQTSAASTAMIRLPPHRSSRIPTWTGWYLH